MGQTRRWLRLIIPWARVWDVLLAHPDVDVELRVNLVCLSPTDPNRARAARLEGLDEDDPDRELWEPEHQCGSFGMRSWMLEQIEAGADGLVGVSEG